MTVPLSSRLQDRLAGGKCVIGGEGTTSWEAVPGPMEISGEDASVAASSEEHAPIRTKSRKMTIEYLMFWPSSGHNCSDSDNEHLFWFLN